MRGSARKPIASLSLDADNQWSYMKIHGDDGWDSFPSYLDVLAPRALDVLARQDLRITFFIVGQDAALPENRDALGALARAGHEIGNHSYRHEPWLHRYSETELEDPAHVHRSARPRVLLPDREALGREAGRA